MSDGPVSRFNGVDYSGADERLLHAALLQRVGSGAFAARTGRRPGAAAPTASGLTITVPADAGVIYDPSLGGGPWLWALPSSKAVTLDERPGSGTSRIDVIVARIYDIEGQRELKIEAVKGEASGSPSKPDLPARSCEILTVTVPASGAVSIVASTVRTVAAGGILPVATTTERDALPSPHVGLAVHVEADDALYIQGASSWRRYSPEDDSGWVNLTIAAGYQAQSPGIYGTPAVRRLNGIVHFQGAITRTTGSFPASAVTLIARVPAGSGPGLRPTTQWEGMAAGSTSVSDPKISILRAADTSSDGAGALRAHVGASVPAYIVLSDIRYPIG